MREFWPERHGGLPIEQRGVSIADGNGGQACAISVSLAKLGYTVGLYRDSDVPLTDAEQSQLVQAGVSVIEYGSGLNTEQAIFTDAGADFIQAVLTHARANLGADSVDNNLVAALSGATLLDIRRPFHEWESAGPLTGALLRAAIADVAIRKKWFKSQRAARDVAPVIWNYLGNGHPRAFSNCVLSAENWLYG